MIDEAVIFSSELGERSAESGQWALAKVGGVPVIDRAVLTMQKAKMTRIIVVCDDSRVSLRVAALQARMTEETQLISIQASGENMTKTLALVRERIQGAFVAILGNRIFDAELVHRLASTTKLDAANVVLAADMDTSIPGIPLQLLAEHGVGQSAVFSGAFAATANFLDALAATEEPRTWEHVISWSTRSELVSFCDVSQVGWYPANSEAHRAEAERHLLRSLTKTTDGPVVRHFHRKLSYWITRSVMNTPLRPNHMTLVSALVGGLAVYAILGATWTSLVVGALLVQAEGILDCCDGELARLKFQGSYFGSWFDTVVGDILNVSFALAIGWSTAELLGQPIYQHLVFAGVGGYLIYDCLVYVQLGLIKAPGTTLNFRWWFQTANDSLVAAVRTPKGMTSYFTRGLHSLGRHEVFMFSFLLLLVARLPHIVVIWYTILGVCHGVLTLLHVSAGGIGKSTRQAREPS